MMSCTEYKSYIHVNNSLFKKDHLPYKYKELWKILDKKLSQKPYENGLCVRFQEDFNRRRRSVWTPRGHRDTITRIANRFTRTSTGIHPKQRTQNMEIPHRRLEIPRHRNFENLKLSAMCTNGLKD